MIGTLESYQKMKEYFGETVLIPIYIEVEDGERLCRALDRERRRWSQDMTNCADGSWRTRRISPRRSFRRPGSPEGTGIRTRYNVWKKLQRKYGMGSFKDVVGHKDIIQYIQNAVTEDKVSHAYILNGREGIAGRSMLAIFSPPLFCVRRKGPESCGMNAIPVSRRRAAIIRILSG